MNNNALIMEMMAIESEDPEFRKQMKDIKPETKKFINAMMKTFDEINLKNKSIDFKEQMETLKSNSPIISRHSTNRFKFTEFSLTNCEVGIGNSIDKEGKEKDCVEMACAMKKKLKRMVDVHSN